MSTQKLQMHLWACCSSIYFHYTQLIPNKQGIVPWAPEHVVLQNSLLDGNQFVQKYTSAILNAIYCKQIHKIQIHEKCNGFCSRRNATYRYRDKWWCHDVITTHLLLTCSALRFVSRFSNFDSQQFGGFFVSFRDSTSLTIGIFHLLTCYL